VGKRGKGDQMIASGHFLEWALKQWEIVGRSTIELMRRRVAAKEPPRISVVIERLETRISFCP
jgi:hypothetical protein